MEELNCGIVCDVKKCRHNFNGKSCTLNTVKVSCDCEDCTCCESYESSFNE